MQILTKQVRSKKIVRNLCNKKYNSHTTPLYFDNYLLKASDLLYYSQVLFCMKYRIDLQPRIFYKFLKYSYESGDRSQRDSCLNFHFPSSGLASQKFPLIEIIRAWNLLPYFYKSSFDLKGFKVMVKQFLLYKYEGFICDKIKCFACGKSEKFNM